MNYYDDATESAIPLDEPEVEIEEDEHGKEPEDDGDDFDDPRPRPEKDFLDRLPEEFSPLMELPQEKPPKVSFITGPAGTGKTFSMKQRILADRKYGMLCATTGIAAVNLDSITVNSVLGYFDTEDLEDKYQQGRITQAMVSLRREGYRNLIIDEVSMMSAEQLDLLYMAAAKTGMYAGVGDSLGLIVTGDFAQLPPVNARWAFEADCWPRFEANTTRLTKFWRQKSPKFLEALQAARRGNGGECVALLQELGVEFASGIATDYDGTTVVSTNAEVSRFNSIQLMKLPGRPFGLKTERWGRQRGEWMWNPVREVGIPDVVPMKIGALVMILANQIPNFDYANGDLGHVVDVGQRANGKVIIYVELKRTGAIVKIGRIHRKHLVKELPKEYEAAARDSKGRPKYTGRNPHNIPYWDPDARKWVIGGITYFPLRLGYASTVHKSQGLSLDSIQVDIRKAFFGEKNMAYVALSRVRTPEGLRIVGTPELLARRIKAAPEVVARWL